MKRSLSKIILSIFLAVLIGTLVPVQVYADQPTYISELAIKYGSTEDEAKEALRAEDFTPLDGNFNKGGKKCVAVGYKTTDNRDEAITDVRVMEEKGGYSFSEYEAMLKNMEASVELLYDDSFKIAIEEFKENYAAENEVALFVYDILNYYTNDDIKITDEETGKERPIGVGEMIISDDITDEQFKTLLLQANTEAVANIEQLLAMACSTENWVEAASKCMAYDIVTTEQSNAAQGVYNTLEAFQKEVKAYEDLLVDENSTKEEIDAFATNDSTTSDQLNAFNNISPIYTTLKETSYLDTTLYDFLMQDLNKITIKDIAPLTAAMTPGQIATIGYVPLYQSIRYALNTEDNWSDIISEDIVQNYKDSMVSGSVYYGVDRRIFNADGIALTNEALTLKNQNNLQQLGVQTFNSDSVCIHMIVGIVGLSVAAAGAYVAYYKIPREITTHLYNSVQGVVDDVSSEGAAIITNEYIENMAGEVVSPFTQNVEQAAKMAQSGYDEVIVETGSWGGVVAGCVMVAIGLIVAVLSLTKAIVDLRKASKHPTYTEMPRIMVNSTKLADGSYDLTYYYAAIETFGKTEETTILGDLNSWNGNHWIGLYYTTDAKAGKPLTTKYTVNYGTQLTATEIKADDLRPVRFFSGSGAYNLNNNGCYDKELSDDDKVYLYFGNENTASSSIASVFSSTGGVAGVSAFGGLLIGVVATMLIGKGKKKNDQDIVTTSN